MSGDGGGRAIGRSAAREANVRSGVEKGMRVRWLLMWNERERQLLVMAMCVR
jgi:hypothetical protein